MAVQYVNTKAEFDNILSTFDGVVLADFFATWCGPCKMLSPILDELAEEVDPTKVKILKIDIDEAQELAQEYGVMSVPTVFVGTNHEIKEGFLGANPKIFYKEKIEQYSTPTAETACESASEGTCKSTAETACKSAPEATCNSACESAN